MPGMLVVGSVAYDTVDTPSGRNDNQHLVSVINVSLDALSHSLDAVKIGD